MEGLGWRIGNGTNVQVWHDKWIPKGHVLSDLGTQPDDYSNMLVLELIDYNTSCWDVVTLSNFFDAEIVDAILTIPLSNRWPNDNLYWWLNKNGKYSMKSGYWVGLLGHTHEDDNVVDAADKKLWSTVWNISGPPKLRHFIWRSCKGSLVTKKYLFQRYSAPSPTCDRCDTGTESIILALIDCPLSSPMWNSHTACRLLDGAPRSSFFNLLGRLHDHEARDELSSIYATLWAAWFPVMNTLLKEPTWI